MRILAFTHGYVIRKLLTKSTDIPPNVSIYEEHNELPVIQIMDGIYIRRGFNINETDYQDQDDKMKNICSLSLHSLRGDINKLLNGEQILTYKKSKTKTKTKTKRKYNKRRSNKKTRM